jgi:hypothetical protein
VDDDNWVMVVDLADCEVLGASRVIVGFDSDDLTCYEEADAQPKEIAAGRAVRVPPQWRRRRHFISARHPGRGHPGRVFLTVG